MAVENPFGLVDVYFETIGHAHIGKDFLCIQRLIYVRNGCYSELKS